MCKLLVDELRRWGKTAHHGVPHHKRLGTVFGKAGACEPLAFVIPNKVTG
jgi:hypothetical protein